MSARDNAVTGAFVLLATATLAIAACCPGDRGDRRAPVEGAADCIRPGTYRVALARADWRCEGGVPGAPAPAPDLASAGFDVVIEGPAPGDVPGALRVVGGGLLADTTISVIPIDGCTLDTTVRDPVGAMTLSDVRLEFAGDDVIGTVGSARRSWFVSWQRPRHDPATEAQLQGSLATTGADGPTVTVHRGVSCGADGIELHGQRTDASRSL